MSIPAVKIPVNSNAVAQVVSNPTKFGAEVKNYIAQQAAQKELKDAMPKAVKTLNKIKDMLGGEATNICINALGTGLIAPVFIKYNFLSKTDNDTRTYSAWRQPVSAFLSVATSVSLLIPINRWMNKLSNEGKLLGFDMFNQGGLQNEDYLKKRVKAANPKATKDQIKDLVKLEQNKQRQALIDSIKKHNTIRFVDKSGKTVEMNEKAFKELVTGLLGETEDKYIDQIERYKGEKLKHQTASSVYKFEHQERVNKFLTEAKAKAAECGNKQEEMQSWLKSQISTMKANKQDPELITMATDISKRLDMKTISNKIDADIAKVEYYSKFKTKEQVEADVKKNIENQVEAAKGRLKSVQEMKKQIAEGKKVKSVLEHLDASHPLKNNFMMDIVEKYSGNIGKNMKGWNAISGLVISFALLPISCDLLNRLYPKFMDTFFPNLSKKKKPEDQKPVGSAANTQEVNK